MVPSSSERDLRETVGRVSAGPGEFYSEFFWTVDGHASIDDDELAQDLNKLNLSRDPSTSPPVEFIDLYSIHHHPEGRHMELSATQVQL